MSSPNSSTSNETAQPSLPTFFTTPNTILTKLTQANCPLWKAQAVSYFCGQGVFGYITGMILAPPATVDAFHPETSAIYAVPNPANETWMKQDALVLSILLSTLTDIVRIPVFL